MLNIDRKRIRKLRLLLDQLCYDIIIGYREILDIKCLPGKTRVFIQLFHLKNKIRILDARSILGPDVVDDLLKLKLVITKGSYVEAQYKIASLLNCYFLYEHDPSPHEFAYLGPDSYILAKNLPFNFNPSKILDLCSGTGIQAILLAKSAKRIIGIELSPAAVNVSQFNVVLNNVEDKVKILHGDLYKPVKNVKFDLIVSNPPSIPVPDTLKYPICGRGGEDGSLVLKNIFNNISNYMTKNAVGLITGFTLGDHRYPFILDFFRKVSKREKLDIHILVLYRTSRWKEIADRKTILQYYQLDGRLDPGSEMNRIYDEAEASYNYGYLVKLKKGKSNVTLTFLFDKNNNKNETRRIKDTFLINSKNQFESYFMNKEYGKAMEILNNMKNFCRIFSLKQYGEIHLNLGRCYQSLNQYKKAINEFKKAKKAGLKNININPMVLKCYSSMKDIKKINKELDSAYSRLRQFKNGPCAK